MRGTHFRRRETSRLELAYEQDRMARRSVRSGAAALAVGLAACAGGSPSAPTTPAGPHRSRPAGAALSARADADLFVGGGAIDVDLRYQDPPVEPAEIDRWIRRGATMVSEYYGRFPVPKLRVEVVRGGFGAVGFGQHFAGKRIRVHLGSGTTANDLARDWVLVHEMLHAAFPRLPRRHRWMQEGLSTYLETIVRARAGIFSERDVWRKWTRYMPHGLPRAGDRGLDRTHTWGRTYWGGAIFWLLTDVEIRRRSGGTRSLRDALVAILEAGGNGRAVWSSERVVAIGDGGTGTRVLRDLYDRLARRPGKVDLRALWAKLGVRIEGRGRVRFDDGAPLAKLRRAMSQPEYQLASHR
jgi:hypothetical protein